MAHLCKTIVVTKHSAFSIYRGRFLRKLLRKTQQSSPVRASYGCLFLVRSLNKVLFSSLGIVFNNYQLCYIEP